MCVSTQTTIPVPSVVVRIPGNRFDMAGRWCNSRAGFPSGEKSVAVGRIRAPSGTPEAYSSENDLGLVDIAHLAGRFQAGFPALDAGHIGDLPTPAADEMVVPDTVGFEERAAGSGIGSQKDARLDQRPQRVVDGHAREAAAEGGQDLVGRPMASQPPQGRVYRQPRAGHPKAGLPQAIRELLVR
jgi:hypothetical protein